MATTTATSSTSLSPLSSLTRPRSFSLLAVPTTAFRSLSLLKTQLPSLSTTHHHHRHRLYCKKEDDEEDEAEDEDEDEAEAEDEDEDGDEDDDKKRIANYDIKFFEDPTLFEGEVPFDPPERPVGYVDMPPIDEPPFETEEEEAIAYEKLYGPAYSGVSYLGNDIDVMDAKIQKSTRLGSNIKKPKVKDGFEETVVQVRRVTKVVKGGKNMKFRAVVVVGNKKGQVGVGVGKAQEVINAVQKAATDARRNIVTVPMTKYLTFPHRNQADYGAATVMLRPAAPGSGVIAGGAVRIVIEMAGLENALGKQLGSKNALNNARATVKAILGMKQFSQVASERGIPMEELWK